MEQVFVALAEICEGGGFCRGAGGSKYAMASIEELPGEGVADAAIRAGDEDGLSHAGKYASGREGGRVIVLKKGQVCGALARMAAWRRAWSQRTRAVMASTMGTARGRTQGSWRPRAASSMG